MFPLFLIVMVAGGWWLLNREHPSKNQPKQLTGAPIPLAGTPPDDLGLILTYHSAMFNPSLYTRDNLGAIAQELFSSGYQFEGADLVARANGQVYPNEVLIYHDIVTRPNDYQAAQIADVAGLLSGAGYITYANDLASFLGATA